MYDSQSFVPLSVLLRLSTSVHWHFITLIHLRDQHVSTPSSNDLFLVVAIASFLVAAILRPVEGELLFRDVPNGERVGQAVISFLDSVRGS